MSKIDWYSKIQSELEGTVKAQGALIGIGRDMPDPRSTLYKFTSPSLNWATDGGIPGGKVLLTYGPESSGKSFLLLDLIKNAQAFDKDAWAAIYDSEFSFDKGYAAKMGVDVSRLLVVQSNDSRDIFDHFVEKVCPMVQDGFPLRILGIDSVRAIRGPKEAALEAVEDHVMADLAILLPKATKKMIGPIRQNGICTVLVQQVNEEMDAAKVKYEGKRWKVPNGQALKHFADVMMLVERVNGKASKLFDSADIQYGHTVRAKAEKNKVGQPYRVSEFQLEYGKGIVNVHAEVAGLAIKLGVVQRPNQSTYKYGDLSFHGRPKFEAALAADEILQAALMSDVMKIRRDPDAPALVASAQDEDDFGL